MKLVSIGVVFALLCAVGAYWAADAWFQDRFPTSNLTIEEINAREGVLANTRQAFLSQGPDRSVPFRVLFYGQSITEGTWPEKVVEGWSTRYPHLAIDYENRAIGGFAASKLRRTVAADIADISPDLVVFHVYGDHRYYEETVHTLARMTGADIILQTDHTTKWPAPRCDIGLTVLPGDALGCKGFPFQQQVGWQEYMSYHFVPALAERYGFAVEPRLQRWTNELHVRGVEPSALLSDEVHLNDAGAALMAELLDAFVDELVHSDTASAGARRVRMEVPSPEADGHIAFTVSDVYRIEAVGSDEGAGLGTVVVDERPVEEMAACYAHGRPSRLRQDLVWPAIKQVGASAPLVEEDWTVAITDIAPDGTAFAFSVSGSVTGPDGAGTSGEDFTSPSGRVLIMAQDWMLAEAYTLHNVSYETPFEVTWETRYLCDDVIELAGDGKPIYIQTLATGLTAGSYTVQLRMEPEAIAGIDHILLTPSRTRD